MQRIANAEHVRSWCDARRASGRRIGFVPTMGALHEGHLSLVRLAAEHADQVVVSIFVNPLQFGPREDLAHYPRDVMGDAEKCAALGVDLLFVPSAKELYPPGFQTRVIVSDLSRGLCGAARPGHFEGVCTVVAKLFNIVGPCVAVFGEKDYQQLQIVRRMVRDLQLPIEVVAAPIVREPDGLAMSSRNTYLSTPQRVAATSLYAALLAIQRRSEAEVMAARDAVELASSIIDAAPDTRIEYVEVCDAETLEPLTDVRPGGTLVALAVNVGQTRLIDNILL